MSVWSLVFWCLVALLVYALGRALWLLLVVLPRTERERPKERLFYLRYGMPSSVGWRFVMPPGVELLELRATHNFGVSMIEVIARGLPEKFSSEWKPMHGMHV